VQELDGIADALRARRFAGVSDGMQATRASEIEGVDVHSGRKICFVSSQAYTDHAEARVR
jgi:hypothetical protein